MGADKLALIAGICIFAAALCRVFDNGAKEYGVLVKTAVVAVISMAVVLAIVPVTERIYALYEYTGGSSEYFTVMIKAIGICFLTRLAGDICRDSGESALAVQAETAGKAALLMVSLPLFEEAAELARGLIY